MRPGDEHAPRQDRDRGPGSDPAGPASRPHELPPSLPSTGLRPPPEARLAAAPPRLADAQTERGSGSAGPAVCGPRSLASSSPHPTSPVCLSRMIHPLGIYAASASTGFASSLVQHTPSSGGWLVSFPHPDRGFLPPTRHSLLKTFKAQSQAHAPTEATSSRHSPGASLPSRHPRYLLPTE